MVLRNTHVLRRILAPLTVIVMSACGDDKKDDPGLALSFELAAPSSSDASLLATRDVGRALRDSDHTDTVSFTPSSFKLPIMKISLSKADYTNEQVLYRCTAGSEAACLVDLTSQAALDALATSARSATVAPDTYTFVTINSCADGRSGMEATVAKITGQAPSALSGNTYRTQAGTSSAGTSGAAVEVDVGNWSCSAKTIQLNPPVTVSESSTNVTLTILVDNTYLGYFGTNISGGLGGCKINEGTAFGVGVCVNYPALMGYIGSSASIKRYMISHHRTDAAQIVQGYANAILMVAVDSSGKGLSAFGRPFYGAQSRTPGRSMSDSSNGSYDIKDPVFGGPGWGNSLDMQTFAVNADGTIAFKFGGSLDLKGANVSAFNISTTVQAGLVKTRDEVDTWHYKAYPMP